MWAELIRDTLTRPRIAARRVLDLGLPGDVLLTALVAVTSAGMVLAFLAGHMASGGVDAMTMAVLQAPLIGAAFQLLVMGAIALGASRIGRAFGGTGGDGDALALVVWLNVMMLLAQLAQIAALVILPPLAFVLAILTMIWLLWAFSNFIAEMHGFSSIGAVLGGVVLSLLIFFLGLASVLASLGFGPQGAS